MKIRINKDIVEFIPEHAAETAELEALWVKMGNCVGKTKALQPMGVYVPSEKNVAVFHILGNADHMLSRPAHLTLLLDKLAAGHLALGADEALGDGVAFIDITADGANELLHSNIPPIFNFLVQISCYSRSRAR